MVEALKKRGRDEEALEYGVLIPFLAGAVHNIAFEDVLDMTVDEVALLLRLPPKPSGWDNFYWGRAMLG